MQWFISNTIYANDNRNAIKHNKLFNITGNDYYAKKTEHTNNIINNTTKHNHNNYENNVIKKVNKHITHINNYATEIKHYNKKVNKHIKHMNNYDIDINYYNKQSITVVIITPTMVLLTLEKQKNISLPQQTDTVNNITETKKNKQ